MAPQRQTSPFPTFDSTAEQWKDCMLRFETFVNADSVHDEKKALVFLTNQTIGTYKLITNYASQQDIPTKANDIKCSGITDFMSMNYDPTQFTVRERYKFWSTIKRSLERRPLNWQLGSDRWKPHATSQPSRIHWTSRCGPASSAPSTMSHHEVRVP